MRNYERKTTRGTVSLDIYKTAARLVTDEGRFIAKTFELCHVTLSRFIKKQKMDQNKSVGHKKP